MISDDIPYYEQYINAHSSEEGITIRVILSYPDDYIALLRENEELRRKARNYDQVSAKYGMELVRAINAEDKLHTLRQFLDDLGIIIPGFKW